MPAPIELSSVVHLVRPAGRRAHHLEELRAGIEQATPTTLFLHTVQCQLRHPAAAALPPDDFSGWVNGVVQDRETAERLSFAVQYRGGSPEELREALLAMLAAVPATLRLERDAPAAGEFVFLEVESVVVATGVLAVDGETLMQGLAEADPAVWFYHFIEQPWLTPDAPSLIDWVRAGNELRLEEWIEEARGSGRPLDDVRRRVMRRWRQSRLGRRLADAADGTERDRREAGREAVAGLVRRITGTEDSR
jgi:Family of unknown function (DUF5752)